MIAGDISERLTDRVLPWIGAQNLGFPVVYVPGNHDFYRTEVLWEVAYAQELAADLGIHLLAAGETVVIDGVRLVGATLWTDYNLFGDRQESMRLAMIGMIDHRLIGHGKFSTRLLPAHALELHRHQLAAIETVLATDFGGPTAVVTHHAPHKKSIHPQYQRDPISPAFVSDLSALIERFQPELWVHGHVHSQFDYRVGNTRVICNPRGYVRANRGNRLVDSDNMREREQPQRENPDFNPALVIEI